MLLLFTSSASGLLTSLALYLNIVPCPDFCAKRTPWLYTYSVYRAPNSKSAYLSPLKAVAVMSITSVGKLAKVYSAISLLNTHLTYNPQSATKIP